MTVRNWMIAVGALSVAVTSAVWAQTAPMDQEKTAKITAKTTTYTGCVATGATSGTYMLTHSMADSTKAMDKGSMNHDKGAMGKGSMGKGSMDKDATASTMMLMGTGVDFSKHVGHKISVTGMMAEPHKMGGMQKSNATGTSDSMQMAGFTVTSMKMISTSCDM